MSVYFIHIHALIIKYFLGSSENHKKNVIELSIQQRVDTYDSMNNLAQVKHLKEWELVIK